MLEHLGTGRPVWKMSCELALLAGRPCDSPGCAALDEATSRTLFEQSDASFGGRTRAALEAERDARQIAILQVLDALNAKST